MKFKQVSDDDPSAEFEAFENASGGKMLVPISRKKTNAQIALEIYTHDGYYEQRVATAKILDIVDAKIAEALKK